MLLTRRLFVLPRHWDITPRLHGQASKENFSWREKQSEAVISSQITEEKTVIPELDAP